MTNEPIKHEDLDPAVGTLLDDLKELGEAFASDDLVFFDDTLEDLLPRVARRLITYEDPTKALVQIADILRIWITDPTLIPEDR